MFKRFEYVPNDRPVSAWAVCDGAGVRLVLAFAVDYSSLSSIGWPPGREKNNSIASRKPYRGYRPRPSRGRFVRADSWRVLSC